MSTEPHPPSTQPSLTRPAARPEELPPVTPPSAGYIIQLFLIPALIVAAVVSVWALFGKLADSETDWRQMVSELGSSNEHRRWRAALGLAQLLRNSELAPKEGEVPLAEQPIVVEGLTQLLKESLATKSNSDEEIRHQEFLARTLGSLNADDTVLPILAQAMSPDNDIDVRKSALMSVAAIAGRHFEQITNYDSAHQPGVGIGERQLPLTEPTISDEATLQQLKLAAQDQDPVIRHLAGFAIGSVSGPDAMASLKVMLDDSDSNARANAAIGLARNGLVDGVSALESLLKASNQPFDFRSVQSLPQEQQQAAKARYEVEQPIIARICLRALLELWPRIDGQRQAELKQLMQQLADSHFAADVRALASDAVKQISMN